MLVCVNIPDCHRPWHDKTSYRIMLDVMSDIYKQHGKIDEINICGDYADFYGLSLHDKLPEDMTIKERIDDEVEDVKHGLKELRELFPLSIINYYEGNHEYRLKKYMMKKCSELYNFISLECLLGIHKLDINFIKYGRNQIGEMIKGSNTYIRHVPYSASKNCASGTAHKKAVNLSFGHTHRRQSYTFKNGKGEIISCNSLGWLGDPTANVFGYADHDDWTQGFEIGYLTNGQTYRSYVEIINHMAVHNGKVYK